jgi:molybdate transport system ATP-binding protein
MVGESADSQTGDWMIRARLKKRFRPGPDSAGFTLDVDFETGAGITVLFGPSGSGKTLTLDCIAGFVRAEEGRILLDDDLLFDGRTRVHLPPQARRCGYVFQNYALFPHMTLRENLEFAAERRPPLERRRRVNEMLEQFRLSEVSGRKPRELSGGQKQRCSIARALLGEPRLLLLDEPARGLDPALRRELYDALRQVRAEFQTPMLLVTHDLEECFALGEHMLVLRDGKVAQAGAPLEIYERPANVEVARLLGIFNLVQVEIRALDPGRNTSRVKLDDCELSGPYYPGKFKGDSVWLCVRPQDLRAAPRDGKIGPNQAPATLVRATGMPGGVRLEFDGGLAVEVPRAEYEPHKNVKEWVVEFPPAVMRVL